MTRRQVSKPSKPAKIQNGGQYGRKYRCVHGVSWDMEFHCPISNGMHSFTYLTIYIWILLYVAFCTIMAISRQKEARSRDYALLLFRMTSRVLYSAQYHRQHYTLQAFEQFGALFMHNHDDKYPTRPGFEPGTCTSKSQAPVDTNEPSGPTYISDQAVP